jgi:hypothetical protein
LSPPRINFCPVPNETESFRFGLRIPAATFSNAVTRAHEERHAQWGVSTDSVRIVAFDREGIKPEIFSSLAARNKLFLALVAGNPALGKAQPIVAFGLFFRDDHHKGNTVCPERRNPIGTSRRHEVAQDLQLQLESASLAAIPALVSYHPPLRYQLLCEERTSCLYKGLASARQIVFGKSGSSTSPKGPWSAPPCGCCSINLNPRQARIK